MLKKNQESNLGSLPLYHVMLQLKCYTGKGGFFCFFFLTHRCRASMGALKKVSKDCDLPFWSSWRWSNNGIRTRRSLPIIEQAMGPGEPVREVLATVVSGWGWRGQDGKAVCPIWSAFQVRVCMCTHAWVYASRKGSAAEEVSCGFKVCMSDSRFFHCLLFLLPLKCQAVTMSRAFQSTVPETCCQALTCHLQLPILSSSPTGSGVPPCSLLFAALSVPTEGNSLLTAQHTLMQLSLLFFINRFYFQYKFRFTEKLSGQNTCTFLPSHTISPINIIHQHGISVSVTIH